MRFLRGGEDVTGATLTRLFGVHVAILPAIATALVALHLCARPDSRHECAAGRGTRERSGGAPRAVHAVHPAFRAARTVRLDDRAGASGRALRFLSMGAGDKADPFAPAPAGIRPEW